MYLKCFFWSLPCINKSNHPFNKSKKHLVKSPRKLTKLNQGDVQRLRFVHLKHHKNSWITFRIRPLKVILNTIKKGEHMGVNPKIGGFYVSPKMVLVKRRGNNKHEKKNEIRIDDLGGFIPPLFLVQHLANPDVWRTFPSHL